MAASTELRMDQLPSDPLLHVLSFLGFRDLIQYVPESRSALGTELTLTGSSVCLLKSASKQAAAG